MQSPTASECPRRGDAGAVGRFRAGILARALPVVALGILPALLSGCGSDNASPSDQSFTPLHYEFLTPLRLNVAGIDIEDNAQHPDDDLARRSPVSPAAAMQQMAHDRLIAAGPSGSATFTVTQASITRNDDGGLTEQLTAHLDITGADGSHAGYAEAHVSRSMTTPDGAGPALYYELTRQAMRDMNVEFEYQVRHSLKDWLVDAGAPEGNVQATPLPGSPALPPVAPSPDQGAGAGGAPVELAPPPAASASPTAPLPPGSAPLPPGSAPGSATPLAPPLPDALPPSSSAPMLSPPPGYLVPPPSGFVPPSASYGSPAAGGGY